MVGLTTVSKSEFIRRSNLFFIGKTDILRGAFDITLLASIASHLVYWTDEDVSHFMISQLLARQRVLKEPKH
jgi:hypothetical protein